MIRQLLEEARRLIRIPSVSADGNEEIANYVHGLMQAKGMKVSLQQVLHSFESISRRQFNVIGIAGDPLVDKKTRKGLLLSTHLDTVGAGLREHWTETGGDPFCATVKDGKVFGLGSADAKIDFLCKLKAIEKFREKKLRQPIYLVGTCAEEIGMLGVKYLVKSGALNPKQILVGEPSDLKVVYAHKSLCMFVAKFGFKLVERDSKGFNRRVEMHSYGLSAHGSYPHLGRNAIHQLFDFLNRSQENGFDLRYSRIEGGESQNKVPDRATAEFFLTSYQYEDFKGFFRELAKTQYPPGAFKIEIGGLGEMGVRFFPPPLFACLVEVLISFRELGRRLEQEQDVSYNPSFSTVSFGRMQQSLAEIRMDFDLRLLPSVNPEKILGEIRTTVAGIAARYPELNVSVERDRYNPCLNMPEDHPFVGICGEAMTEAGIEPFLDKKSTSTEAAQYFAAGYDAVVFGPGRSHGNSHSPNEHNLVAQVEKATRFYELVIEKTCL